jgi:hypothetical protein
MEFPLSRTARILLTSVSFGDNKHDKAIFCQLLHVDVFFLLILERCIRDGITYLKSPICRIFFLCRSGLCFERGFRLSVRISHLINRERRRRIP